MEIDKLVKKKITIDYYETLALVDALGDSIRKDCKKVNATAVLLTYDFKGQADYIISKLNVLKSVHKKFHKQLEVD